MPEESKDIPRYSMIGTPGGYRACDDQTGEWVRYEDVCNLVKEIFKDFNAGNPPDINTIVKYL
jgi:hypothetical protein